MNQIFNFLKYFCSTFTLIFRVTHWVRPWTFTELQLADSHLDTILKGTVLNLWKHNEKLSVPKPSNTILNYWSSHFLYDMRVPNFYSDITLFDESFPKPFSLQ